MLFGLEKGDTEKGLLQPAPGGGGRGTVTACLLLVVTPAVQCGCPGITPTLTAGSVTGFTLHRCAS